MITSLGGRQAARRRSLAWRLALGSNSGNVAVGDIRTYLRNFKGLSQSKKPPFAITPLVVLPSPRHNEVGQCNFI